MIDKRLLSVWVVTILVLSIIVFSFPMGIATNQPLENFGFEDSESQMLHGEGQWITEESYYHEEILEDKVQDWDFSGSFTEEDEDGFMYSRDGRDIIRSQEKDEWEYTGYEHNLSITSLHLFDGMLFLGDREGGVYFSEDNGETFDKALQLEYVGDPEEVGWDGYKYANHWVVDSDEEKLLVGEYGSKSNHSKVYRLDAGQDPTDDWSVFYDVQNKGNVTNENAHVHHLSIDPYDNLVYVTQGDYQVAREQFVYDEDKDEWTGHTVYRGIDTDSISNGFLASVYPDENRVLFFEDNVQVVHEYDKRTEEFRRIADFPNPTDGAGPRFYDAVLDEETGVIYGGLTDYDSTEWDRIWISLDGVTWYSLFRRDEDNIGTHPLHIERGRLYMGGTSYMELLCRDEAEKLIYPNETREFEGTLPEGRVFDLPHRQTLEDVEIEITGREMKNLVGEDTALMKSTEDWYLDDEPISSENLSDDSYVGENSLNVEFYEDVTGHDALTWEPDDFELETGEIYHIGVALKTDAEIDSELDTPRWELWFRDEDGDPHLPIRFDLLTIDEEWKYFSDSIYIPEEKDWNFDKLHLRPNQLAQSNAQVWIDGVFISPDTNSAFPGGEFLGNESYSQDVELRIDEDLYEIGDLEPGETETITVPELNSEFELLSGGVVDISYHDSALELIDLDLPKEVGKGNAENLEATVKNQAETEQEVYLYIDTEKVSSKNIGINEQITLDTEYTFHELGDIKIEVRDEEDITIGSETVTVLDLFELSIDIEGEGEVNREPDEDEYIEGTEVELEAISDEGWNFSHWEGGHLEDQINESEIRLKMDENIDLTAFFEETIEYYELIVDIDGSGEVEIDPEQDEYEEGTTVNLNALPDEGHEFVEWTGDYDSDETGITLIIEEDMEITADFEEETLSPWWYSLIFIVIGIVIIGIYLIKSRFEYEDESALEEDEEVKTKSGLKDTEESKELSEKEITEDGETGEEKQVETKTLHCMNCNKYTDHEEASPVGKRWKCKECGSTRHS